MKRANRLSRSVDVKRVRRNGKKTVHPFLLLVTLPNDKKGLRVAVVAGRTVGAAVQRNRAKRVMRAAIQPWFGEIKPDTDILLQAFPQILPAKSPAVKDALQGMLKRAKLFK